MSPDRFRFLDSNDSESESDSVIHVDASPMDLPEANDIEDSFCAGDFDDPCVDAWPLDMPEANTIMPTTILTSMQSPLLSWLQDAFKSTQYQ